MNQCMEDKDIFRHTKTQILLPTYLSKKLLETDPSKQGSKPRNRKIWCLRAKSGIPSGCSGDTEQTCQKDGIDKTPVEPKDSLKGCFFQ